MSETVNNQYIAITIGPIGEMMSLVTKPAALWGASYIFSYISRRLCELIVEEHIAEYEDIITPFFPKKEETQLYETLIKRKDGVGLFHDHIIVRTSFEENMGKMKKIKRRVLEDAAKIIHPKKCETEEGVKAYTDILEKYIMIAICGFDKKDSTSNAIMYCGKMLDSMELPKHFSPDEKIHPILSGFQSDENNRKIKQIAENFGVDLAQWQLMLNTPQKENNVRDLPDIAAASHSPKFKKNNYYCVLRADEDNMSKIISDLGTDAECRDFSKICLDYCSAVAEAIKQYGGVTIFAGGDDLFALVPCQGEKPKKDKNETSKTITVLELTNEISTIFKKKFSNDIEKIKKKNREIEAENNKTQNDEEKKILIPIPSLSFGVFICHKKFPLYEAIKRSDSLLFRVAKNTNEKNCVAIHLQKHSGQSEELVISNRAFEMNQSNGRPLVFKIFDELIQMTADKNEEILLSASNKILLFKKLFSAANEEKIYNIFQNIFDDEYHLGNKKGFLHIDLPKMYCQYCASGLITLYEDDEKLKDPDGAKTLAQFVRFMKFFVEKGDN